MPYNLFKFTIFIRMFFCVYLRIVHNIHGDVTEPFVGVSDG